MKNIFTKLMYVGVMLMLTMTFANNELSAQCFASFQFGSTTAPTIVGQTNTATTCAFINEYSLITGATAGHLYQFTATASGPVYVTVTQGTPTGTVLAHGFSPVQTTPTASGNLYMHYHSSAACATTSLSCVTGTITLVSVAPPCNYDVPANIVVDNSPGLCGAIVNFSVGQGDCPNPPIVEPPSGSFFPVGTTTVGVGTGTGGYEEFTVTVNDTESPTLTCPSNMNITLNPGECNRIVNYTVDADDNCPFLQPGPTIQIPSSFVAHGSGTAFTLQGNTLPQGIYFDLTNDSGDNLEITGFGIRYGNPAFGAVNPPQNMNVHVAPTHVGNQTNPGAWTQIPTETITTIPAYFDTGTGDLAELILEETVEVLPGQTVGFHFFSATGAVVHNYTFGVQPPVTVGPWTLLGGETSFAELGNLFQPGINAIPNIQIFSNIGGGGDVMQTTGLPSGSTFEVGTVTNCFELEDGAGNLGECCFDITVSEFPNPTLSLVCNNLVNVSVDENCEALINADMILEGGPYKCYDDYIISVETLSGLPVNNPISGLYAGQNLIVSVEDPDTGNSCWGYIKVEDKQKPVIECRDVIISCNEELPTEPAPGIDGPQSIIYEDLNDVVGVPGNPAMVEYEYDFNYLPVDATVQNVGVRIKVQHTWATDMSISIEAPDGSTATVFNVTGGTGCLLANITIDVTFDDNGIDVGNCNGLDLGGALVRPMMGAAAHFNALETFDGIDARGTWKITFTDNVGGDDGNIDIAGIILDVNAPTIDPFDNCGLASVEFSDVIEPGDCDDEYASVVTRTWTATDLSGNQGTCDQIISIERGNLEDYVAPPTWYADCSDNFDLDAYGNPHPSESGSPISEACENIVGTYTDVRINDACGGYKVVRTWTLLDWCTLQTVKLTQLLKVLNEEAPEFVNCPAPGTVVNVSTRFNDCVGDYIAQQLTAINNCTGEPITNIVVTASAGTVVWNQQIQRYQVLNLPVGQHTITYSANDGCDNIAQCTYILNVVDNVPPIAICDERTRVSLGSNGEALVHVSAWDDGSYDNCGIASILAYRKGIRHLFPAATTPCHQGNQNPDRNDPRPQIKFCCADIGEVEIVVEVTDVSGNMNICWVVVEVEDKLPPVVQCPPNVVIDCKYEFDFPLGQLSDAELNATLDAEFGGPLAVDNCELEFEDWIIQYDLYNSQCRIGTPTPPVVNPPMAPYTAYRRVFIAEDAGGNQANCIQDIVILPNFDDPFIGDDLPWPQGDIRWPEDETVGACLSAGDDALSPEALGSEPFLREKGCAKPVASYQDQIFTFVDTACFKILRTWTVIDWCNHNPNTGQGEWSYVQVINVMDDGPATCNNCEDQVFVDEESSDCTGFADLELDVSDCTPEGMLQVSWQIDAFQTGVFDIFGNGLDASGNYPFGEHTIRWTVYDLCSNTAVFEYDFEVVDGKLPSPVCLNGIATVVMPSSGDITIPASFFDVASFDNCTESEDLIFTYSADVTHLTETWSCEDLDGTNEQTFEVEIWVTDEAGNQDYCVTYILIQDNNNICPDTAGGTAAISGFIVNELDEGVENVEVTINGINTNFLLSQQASAAGFFNMDVFVGEEYAIRGERTDNPLNGVTTFDIALMQRHILGTQFLNTPYKLIAADVNNDGKINVLDIAELRRVILGTYSEFPNNDSWKIIVDEPLQMGLTPPAHETVLDLGYVVRDMEETNFIGVKIGDVNASHQASGLISSSERSLVEDLRLQTEDRQVRAGDQVVMEITSDNIDGVFGYQGTINFDASVLEFVNYEAGVLGINDANFGFHLMSEGMITTSWSEVEAVSGSNGEVLFAMVFEAKQDGTLSDLVEFTSARTASESYNERGVMGVEMVFGNRVSTTDFALYQNNPNPFNGQTVIGFVLPETTEATMTIYDVTGKVVRVIEGEYTAGYNELTLDRKDVGSAGVYYYQLDTENHRATKKMVFMD